MFRWCWAAAITTVASLGVDAAAEAGPESQPDALPKEGSPKVEGNELEAPANANIGLVASGGVSLGAYQAGFLHMAVRLQRRRSPVHRRLALAAGTSAGSANALITALNSCLGTTDSPRDDPGWRLWVPTGLDVLFDRAQVTPVSLFTRKALEGPVEEIWEIWKEGLPKDCDVVLALTVTRLQAVEIRVRPGFRVPRQEEKIRVRIQGRGSGTPPKLTNYIDPRFHLEQLVLPLRMDDHRLDSARHNFDQLLKVVFASTAFPVAFKPQPLDYCLWSPVGPDDFVDPEAPYCSEPDHRDLFIDGGVFENYPLRLAETVASDGLRSNQRGESYWRDLTQSETDAQRRRSPPVFFAYVDPFNPSYPPMVDSSTVSKNDSLLGLLGSFSSEFVATARGKELYGAVESDPNLADHLFISTTTYPTASEPLGAFLGFMETDFRIFDFYLGMYDALVLLRNSVLPGDQVPIGNDSKEIPPDWMPFACMLSVYEPRYEGLASACTSGTRRAFRILLQVSVDRIHDHCRRFEPADLELQVEHPGCEGAARGRERPRVPGVKVLASDDIVRSEEETHFRHMMRLMERYGFEFRDLGLDVQHADRGRLMVRRKLVEMADAIAAKQENATDAFVIRSGIRAVTDNIAYDPPKLVGWALLGTLLEGGLSGYPGDAWPTWLRLTSAFQYKGWASLFSDERTRFIGALLGGAEFELQFLSNSLFSPYLGLRAGGQLSTLDGMGSDSCTSRASLGDGRNCSQALIQTYAAASALGWLRVQLILEIYPAPPVVQFFDDVSGVVEEERRFIGLQFALGGQFQ